MSLKDHIKYFSRYHGLNRQDAVFFNQSDLICDMAKKEDFIIMGRCADAILTNNGIPHISILYHCTDRAEDPARDRETRIRSEKARHFLKNLTKNMRTITIFIPEEAGETRITTIYASTAQATELTVLSILF